MNQINSLNFKNPQNCQNWEGKKNDLKIEIWNGISQSHQKFKINL